MLVSLLPEPPRYGSESAALDGERDRHFSGGSKAEGYPVKIRPSADPLSASSLSERHPRASSASERGSRQVPSDTFPERQQWLNAHSSMDGQIPPFVSPRCRKGRSMELVQAELCGTGAGMGCRKLLVQGISFPVEACRSSDFQPAAWHRPGKFSPPTVNGHWRGARMRVYPGDTFHAVPVLAERNRRVSARFWRVVAQKCEPARLGCVAPGEHFGPVTAGAPAAA